MPVGKIILESLWLQQKIEESWFQDFHSEFSIQKNLEMESGMKERHSGTKSWKEIHIRFNYNKVNVQINSLFCSLVYHLGTEAAARRPRRYELRFGTRGVLEVSLKVILKVFHSNKIFVKSLPGNCC